MVLVFVNLMEQANLMASQHGQICVIGEQKFAGAMLTRVSEMGEWRARSGNMFHFR